jgi:hypothetical protein
MSMFTKFMDMLFGLGEEDILDNEMYMLKDVTGFWYDKNVMGLEIKKVTKKCINIKVHYVLSNRIRKVKFPRDLNEIKLNQIRQSTQEAEKYIREHTDPYEYEFAVTHKNVSKTG